MAKAAAKTPASPKTPKTAAAVKEKTRDEDVWWYNGGHYEARFEDDQCSFKDSKAGAEGILSRQGNWWEGDVKLGTIRVQPQADGTLISEFKHSADSSWGSPTIARRVAGVGKKWTSDFSMQVSCVTVAKGLYARPQSAGNGKKERRRENYTKNVKGHMFNHNVCFSADAGKLARAQNWMYKLDNKQGIQAEVRSLNTLLLSLARAGDYDCAEEWFVKCQTPIIHPELVGLAPNADSYNIMIQMFTKARALERAEKWYDLIEQDLQTRPALATQLGLIKTCLDMREVRRAHKLARALVDRGCSQNRNYAPELVKAERIQFRSQREWDVVGFFECLCSLVNALAEVGNSRTAHDWLRYFCNCGVKAEEEPEVWERVRRVHPREIVSCILSGEQDNPLSPGSPSRSQMAILYGDAHTRRGSRMSASGIQRTDTSMSVASSILRPDTSMSLRSARSATPRSARAALSDTGLRSAAATPSLRKFMDAMHRGASPNLAHIRVDGISSESPPLPLCSGDEIAGDQMEAMLASL